MVVQLGQAEQCAVPAGTGERRPLAAAITAQDRVPQPRGRGLRQAKSAPDLVQPEGQLAQNRQLFVVDQAVRGEDAADVDQFNRPIVAVGDLPLANSQRRGCRDRGRARGRRRWLPLYVLRSAFAVYRGDRDGASRTGGIGHRWRPEWGATIQPGSGGSLKSIPAFSDAHKSVRHLPCWGREGGFQ